MDRKHGSRAAAAATLAVCLTAAGVGGWQILRVRQEQSGGPESVSDSVPPVMEAVQPEPLPEPGPEPEPEDAAVSAPAPVYEPEYEPEYRAAETPVYEVVTVPESAPEVPAAVPSDGGDSAERGGEDRKQLTVVLPLYGEAVAAFSMDRLAYNATLGDWRTHDGVDIAAEPGTEVLAACAGTVSAIAEDPLMGLTVSLSHDGGYETTYAGLEEVSALEEGDQIPAGDVVGTVGSSAIAEAAQGPHLHFAVKQNGEAVDPEEFLRLDPGVLGESVESD